MSSLIDEEQGPGDPQKPKPFNAAKAEAETKAIRAQGGSDADVDTYLHQTYGLTPHTGSSDYVPGIGTKILGTLASLGKDIPGVEALQAGVRSVGRTAASHIPGLNIQPENYREALANIHGIEDMAPAAARIPARIVGGVTAAMALPKIPGLAQGGGALQGAQYGALSGLGSSDPDADIRDRVQNATQQAAIGAVGGKVGEMAGNTVRAVGATKLDRNFAARGAASTAADATNYGAAADEANKLVNHPIPQTMLDALSAPDVKPYVDMVAKSRAFASVNDQGLPRASRLLRETYEQLSKQEQGLQQFLRENPYDAAKALEAQNLGLAKKQLLAAADPAMPSFRGAAATHAQNASETDALALGADAGKRIMNKSMISGRKIAKQGEAAFQNTLERMRPSEATAATQGMLGRAKEGIGITPNPLTLFGVGQSAMRINRLAPSLAKADAATGGNTTADLFRSLGLVLPSELTSP